VATHIALKTHFGRNTSAGSRKKVASNIIAEQITLAIWDVPPRSAFSLERVIDPYAGSVPGMKEPAMFAAPVYFICEEEACERNED